MAVNISHVIFDVDGLIVDTERCYSESIEEICQEYGKTFTWEIKVKQMGQKEDVSAKIAIDELSLPLTVEEYRKTLKEKLEQRFPHAKLLPGVEKLIRHLHHYKVPIAVATGSDKWGFAKKTAAHTELFSLFHHAVCASDDPEVKHGKPSPDCFLVCAQRFPDPPKPEQVLVFEDAPNGAEAGLNAGMHVVWVPDPRADRSSLVNRVDEVLDSVAKFVPEKYGLPPYNQS